MLSFTAPLMLVGLTAWAPEVPPPAPQPTSSIMTAEALGPLLENMGYDVKTMKNTADVPYYVITTKRDTWTFVVEVSLSPNKGYVWLGAPLSVVPDLTPDSGPKLLRLLQENGNIAPTFFSYAPGSKRLMLQSAMENHDITPAKLRVRIDGLQDVVRNTFPLWDTSKWSAAPVPPEPSK